MSKDLFTDDDGNPIAYPDAAALLIAGEELGAVEARYEYVEPPVNGNVLVKLDVRDGNKTVVPATDVMDVLDARAKAPRDRRGIHTLLELKSLISYVNRYKTDRTIAWADPSTFRIVVVLDDHPSNGAELDPVTGADVGPALAAAWRNHRAVYECPRSPEWKVWTQNDGRAMAQEAFADFIEQRLEDIKAHGDFPKPTELLTMARNLIVRTKGAFERQIDPTTGNGVLLNKTENDTGSTVIPRAFAISVPVFEGGIPYLVEIKIRMQVTDGRASFMYIMHRRPEIERDAFNEVREDLQSSTEVLLLAGRA